MKNVRLFFLLIITISIFSACAPTADNTIEATYNHLTSGDIVLDKTTHNSSSESRGDLVPSTKEFASKKTVAEIKSIIDSITLVSQEFPINEQQYNSETDMAYKLAYYKAITNQVPVDKYWNGEDAFFQDLLRGEDIARMSKEEFIDFIKEPYKRFWYLDYDGDGLPELIFCTRNSVVLKYDALNDKVNVSLSTGNDTTLLGSNQYCKNILDAHDTRYKSYFCQTRDGNITSISFTNNEKYNDYNISIDGYGSYNLAKDEWHEITSELRDYIENADYYSLPCQSFEEIFGSMN